MKGAKQKEFLSAKLKKVSLELALLADVYDSLLRLLPLIADWAMRRDLHTSRHTPQIMYYMYRVILAT